MASLIKGEVYPVTVTRARYSGIYSRAHWHAWALAPWEVPEKAYGSQPTCAAFWGTHVPGSEGERGADQYMIGRGQTQEEAYEDLREQIKNDTSNE